MELGIQVPQRSFTKCGILLGSACLILGLGAMLLFAGVFDWIDGAPLPKASSTAQVPDVWTNKTSKGGLFCDKYEVCKCVSNAQNDAYSWCVPNTCTYSPSAPSLCCPNGGFMCDDPNCDRPITSWEDCEWANFPDRPTRQRAGGLYPGEGLYSPLPSYSPYVVPYGYRVLTDVDDTIKCSGGPPGGADSYCAGTSPHHTYPGVAEFMLGLSRGSRDINTPSKVIPLSARPDELSAFLAMKDNSPEGLEFQRAGWAVGLTWGLDVDNAQYGSLFDLGDFKWWEDTDLTRYDKLGYRKYANWKNLAPRLGSPTAFVGDNGQGDVVAAQMMLFRSSALRDYQGALRVAFIHDVLNRCASKSCQRKWAQYGIYFFSNYGDAAILAHSLGMISTASCRRVCGVVAVKVYSDCHKTPC